MANVIPNAMPNKLRQGDLLPALDPGMLTPAASYLKHPCTSNNPSPGPTPVPPVPTPPHRHPTALGRIPIPGVRALQPGEPLLPALCWV